MKDSWPTWEKTGEHRLGWAVSSQLLFRDDWYSQSPLGHYQFIPSHPKGLLLASVMPSILRRLMQGLNVNIKLILTAFSENHTRRFHFASITANAEHLLRMTRTGKMALLIIHGTFYVVCSGRSFFRKTVTFCGSAVS
jgi:hypothetical protein